MSKPTHIAYVVIQPQEGSDKKAIWRGRSYLAALERNGFDLVIPIGSACRAGSPAPSGKDRRGRAADSGRKAPSAQVGGVSTPRKKHVAGEADRAPRPARGISHETTHRCLHHQHAI